MDILFNELILVFDINKNVDMVILFGMLMVLNKFVIVIWYCNFLLKNSGVFVVLNFNLTPLFFYSLWQEDYDGVVFIIGNIVLFIFFLCLMNVNELIDMLVCEIKIVGIFLIVWFYVDDWIWNDVWYVFLLGGMSGTVVGLFCYYLMSVCMCFGREIMIVIKCE